MAISLVTASAPTSTGPTLPGNLPGASENGGLSISFGNLLSLQLTGLPAQSLPAGSYSIPEETDDPAANVDAGTLLAGMLAVSPENANVSSIHLPKDQVPKNANQLDFVSQASLTSFQTGPDNAITLLSPSLTPQEHTAALAAKSNSAANFAMPSTASSEVTPGDFAASLATHAANHAGIRHENQIAKDIETPIHDERWVQGFGERMVWMARNDQQSAQININPPQLGPLQITLKLNGDQATASFVSPHTEVRQVIEDAMPRLRELLAGAGIQLGQTNVGAQMAQQDRGSFPQSPDSPRFTSDGAILCNDAGRTEALPPRTWQSGRGLVDLFA